VELDHVDRVPTIRRSTLELDHCGLEALQPPQALRDVVGRRLRGRVTAAELSHASGEVLAAGLRRVEVEVRSRV
jgi:hypothetical protein